MVQSLLDRAGFSIQSLDAVAISIGPGSYTGLRIGLSLAKGICYGSTIPLIPVSTLACMTACAINQYPMQETLYCPMIDARRMEVYTALFDHTGTLLCEPEAYILDNKPSENKQNKDKPVSLAAVQTRQFTSWKTRTPKY